MARATANSRGRSLFLSVFAAIALIPWAGCATLAPRAREAQAAELLTDLEARTAAALPDERPLALHDCIGIALEHNLAIRAAAIDAALARLDVNVAFADFLPRVAASANLTAWSEQPSSNIGGFIQAPMHDRTLRQYSVDAQLPVFVPATWFAYAMRRQGAAAGLLAEELARQAVVLDVTSRYFEALTREAEAEALHSQVAAARAFASEIGAMHAEGLVLDWERDGALANVRALETRLLERQGLAGLARAALLEAMGLDPAAPVTLASAPAPDSVLAPVEELMYRALLAHPALHLADRQAAMAEARVKQAIAAFLPAVSAFASLSGTSNSTSLPGRTLYGGVGGVLSLFDGFANVQEYRMARMRSEKAYVEREAQSLAILLRVLGSHLNVQLARAWHEVAADALAVEEARLEAVRARAAEGLVLPSEQLGALADRDAARLDVTRTLYRRLLSEAMLRHATGAPWTPEPGGDGA
ncbi:MAG: TolC family protein [Candidatus Hydrogenedentes bacterium]|nr:TolC family protein [Candidatus Hydrogenedentota bacterium]